MQNNMRHSANKISRFIKFSSQGSGFLTWCLPPENEALWSKNIIARFFQLLLWCSWDNSITATIASWGLSIKGVGNYEGERGKEIIEFCQKIEVNKSVNMGEVCVKISKKNTEVLILWMIKKRRLFVKEPISFCLMFFMYLFIFNCQSF